MGKANPVPDVSVIVTCYNLERYVGEAIESVLSQDFAGTVEIIVVDDCSSDGSADKIRAFPSVQYVRTESNSGVLLATIRGLQAASADVVFFLDGDDRWEKTKLSKVLPVFASDPHIGLVTHDLVYIDAAGAPLQRGSRPEVVFAGVPEEEWGETVRAGILELDDYVWLGSAFAIRKSVADVEGFIDFAMSLPDPRNTYQDWPLAYWIAAQAQVDLRYVPAKLFQYRLHEFNHSGDARTNERMLRNVTRTLNTTNASLEIARARDLPEGIVRIVEKRLAFYDYRINVASGRRGRALAGFLRNAPELRRRGLLFKELVRLLAVQVLGPERFARVAASRKILRNLPVS